MPPPFRGDLGRLPYGERPERSGATIVLTAMPDAPTDHERARVRAFQLVFELQAGDESALDDLRAMGKTAARERWSDVERATLFGEAVGAWLARSSGRADAVARLVRRCTEDGDAVMLALGLAMRAGGLAVEDGTFPAEQADGDLARASVLLEAGEGGALERITAHTACGIAYANRWLFELSDEQYAAALAIGGGEPAGTVDFLLAPIVFNRAEAQVSWASTLRQLGDVDGIAALRSSWLGDDASRLPSMPEGWRNELDGLGILLGAIAGEDRGGEAAAMLSRLGPGTGPAARCAGHLGLSLALSDVTAGRDGAAERAEAAVAMLDPDSQPHEYDLALHVAAEIEAAAGSGAGLRAARRQVGERWSARLAALGTMRARLQAERVAVEYETLRRHAHLDDLTGAGNRRALDHYLAGLAQRDAATIALVLFDLDDFKAVNDRFGHSAGDAALVRVAKVAEASVRPDDLVVRLGGDEFAIVMADTGLEVAAERMQAVVEQIDRLDWDDIAHGMRITVSAGVAAGYLSHVERLREQADLALYEAKAVGGRTIVRHRAN